MLAHLKSPIHSAPTKNIREKERGYFAVTVHCSGCFGHHMIQKYVIFICDKYKYQLERNTDAKNLTNPTHLNIIDII